MVVSETITLDETHGETNGSGGQPVKRTAGMLSRGKNYYAGVAEW